MAVPAISSAVSFPDTYDVQIRKSAKRWLPAYEAVYGMEILKAQLYQESLLDPNAVSYVGAAGLGQFMPETWTEVSTRLGFAGMSAYSPEHNIEAAAFYMANRLNIWQSPRPMSDRLSLAWACYNAGCGWVLKAQKLCGSPAHYKEIIQCLPQVTGKHARETMTYVERIWRYWMQMRNGG
ncbi:transglycosylase SLT domain-containing protein (plasmid) [Xenorhabdus sp. SF857]|uniref:transglycosylase SLT domain-containing protein n=1 Tax=Xenorhabdus bakwenae TaxID=3026967 RepID=UPI002557C83A|nr:transglycosylase SLT domain-containing protein [Xenorhabdus sp. SF857]WFQ78165.1 transglycosylase SLT domain-containing protein [Xenorhabdus sp. SF857]